MMKLNPIERKVTNLLNYALDQFKPNYIVTVERKGTALIRAVIEQGGIDWSWDRVLSTSSIPGLDSTYLINKRILLFDDSVNHGHSMRKTMDQIVNKFDNKVNIATAAFAVHENCEADIQPDFYFYVGLKDERFEKIRTAVVTFLQERGSLLLDTEHIEIPINLKGSEDKFYHAIASLGKTVRFETLNTLNKNLTLFQPLMEYSQSLINALPTGSNISDGVWKCRFISRPDNKIALIPICYPVLSFPLTEEDKNKLPDCFRVLLLEDNFKLNYYLIGIFASIKMLSGIFAAFAGDEARPVIDIDFPEIYNHEKHDSLSHKEKTAIRKNDTYSHLLAMFPKIDVLVMQELVRSAVDKGIRNRSLYKELLKKYYSQVAIAPADLKIYAGRLSRVILDIIQNTKNFAKNFGIESNGASVYEIINYIEQDEIGKAVPREIFSAAMDQLIDEAIINTDVDQIITDDGIKRVFRTFKPDGEFMISKILRNYYDL